MRVYKKRFKIYKDAWHIFPALVLYIDVPYYPFKNIEVQFHVLCFHWAITFEKVRGREQSDDTRGIN